MHRGPRSSLDVDRAVTLANFDNAATKSQEIAKLLGVPVLDAYKAHLDLASINLKVGGLSLHDGEIPLRQLGLGSHGPVALSTLPINPFNFAYVKPVSA